MVAPTQSRVLKFGLFEVDLEAGELRKSGMHQKLVGQPFEVLRVLLERPQEVITREELQQRIWPQQTFIDYDLALRKAITRLREVLGDSADSPRFIETVPRRGYRFIAPLNGNGAGGAVAELPLTESWRSRRGLQVGIAVGLGIAVLLSAILYLVDSDSWRRLSSKATAPQIRSIAVLPLQNLSADPKQEYFCDGLTDGLITDLAQISSLKVISHTSTVQYKGTKKSLPEIARELNVDGIVEGTVQRSGDRVRITVQLIQGVADKHLWADSYERDMHDVFALEREVTRDIADEVRARITTQSQALSAQPPRRVNLEAFDSYLQGSYHLNKGLMGPRDEELRKAGLLFQRSISADPMFAPAYIGLAEAHHNLWWPSSEDLKIMKSAAQRALEVAPGSSDAHKEIAITKFEDWDWAEAEDQYKLAIRLNPNNASAHDEFGGYLDAMGRLDEGWKEQELAQELDPTSDHLSWALYRRGEYDRAIKLLRTTLQTRREDAVFHWLLSETYAQKGMYKEWVQELSEVWTLVGNPEAAGRLQHAFATSGYSGAMKEWAKAMEKMQAAKQGYFPGMLAQVYVTLGDNDRAFYWLSEGVDHHTKAISDPILEWTKTDPGLASLHSDSRFKELVRRMGLPP